MQCSKLYHRTLYIHSARHAHTRFWLYKFLSEINRRTTNFPYIHVCVCTTQSFRKTLIEFSPKCVELSHHIAHTYQFTIYVYIMYICIAMYIKTTIKNAEVVCVYMCLLVVLLSHYALVPKHIICNLL